MSYLCLESFHGSQTGEHFVVAVASAAYAAVVNNTAAVTFVESAVTVGRLYVVDLHSDVVAAASVHLRFH